MAVTQRGYCSVPATAIRRGLPLAVERFFHVRGLTMRGVAEPISAVLVLSDEGKRRRI